MSAHLWAELHSWASDYRALGEPGTGFAHCWVGLIPGWLAEGTKVSQSEYWPSGGQGQGPGGHGADASLFMGGLGSDMSGYGASVVLGLVSAHCWAGPWSRGS